MPLLQKKYTPLISLAVLLAAVGAPTLSIAVLTSRPVLAQSAVSAQTFQLPQTVAQGTTVAIDGSSSMAAINAALKQRFEQQYPGTKITIGTKGTDASLQALKDGKIQLAAIGRPLTAAEKAAGLVAVPIARHKIALIVGAETPFKGSLTIDQFAKIFRGEITNWAQVGGSSSPIRLVDRPDISDTRQAFQQYPIFQKAPFQVGSTALRVDKDSTTAVIDKLGTDGLGYAIADQVLAKPGIRIVSLHNTLPDNPKYPFSQALSYVYKGPQPSQAIKDFLGYATTPENQQAIESARSQAAKAPAAIAGTIAQIPPTSSNAATTSATKASPSASATTDTTNGYESPTATTAPTAAVGETDSNAQTGTTRSENSVARNAQSSDAEAVSPWWWLLLPLIGLPILWAVWPKARSSVAEDGASPASAPARTDDQPTVNDAPSAAIAGKEIDADAAAGDAVTDGLAPAGDTGSVTEVDNPIGTDLSSTGTDALGAGVLGAGALGAGALGAGALGVAAADKAPIEGDRAPGIPSYETEYGSRIILVPRNASDAYAYWEVSDAHKSAVRQQGGKDLKLRLCDVTDGNWDVPTAHNVYEFDCSEQDRDRHLPIRNSDHEYLVDLGYVTEDGQWLSLTRSRSVQITSDKNHTSV